MKYAITVSPPPRNTLESASGTESQKDLRNARMRTLPSSKSLRSAQRSIIDRVFVQGKDEKKEEKVRAYGERKFQASPHL